MKDRFEELDSLRGLASTTVVLSHLSLILPMVFLINKIKSSPLYIFFAGHEAVILFFILSGFVLSLPFYTGKSQKFKDYLIKRICRIYIPYSVSIFFSILCMRTFSRMGIPGLSHWFNTIWTTPLTREMLLNYVLLLGSIKTDYFNPVIWSLIHEMRISIIFPFLMYFLIKNSWKQNVIFSISIPVLIFSVYYFCIKTFQFDLMVYAYTSTSLLNTIHYIAFFVLGAALAKHTQGLQVIYSNLNIGFKIFLIIIALLGYLDAQWFHDISPLAVFIKDWGIAVGSLIFIFFCLNSKTVKSILLNKLIHFVGKVSYSLYLIHITVIFSLVNVFYGILPIGLILAMAFVTSIIVAGVMYYIVEKPSIKLGRILTKTTTIVYQDAKSERVSIR